MIHPEATDHPPLVALLIWHLKNALHPLGIHNDVRTYMRGSGRLIDIGLRCHTCHRQRPL